MFAYEYGNNNIQDISGFLPWLLPFLMPSLFDSEGKYIIKCNTSKV